MLLADAVADEETAAADAEEEEAAEVDAVVEMRREEEARGRKRDGKNDMLGGRRSDVELEDEDDG